MAEQKNSGFVKLFKSQFDHPIWNNSNYDFGKAWIELWSLASYKPNIFVVDDDLNLRVKLYPGQRYIFPGNLAKRWGWSVTKVNAFLTRLTRANTFKGNDGPMIVKDYPLEKVVGKKITRWGMRVTILNWELYQIRNGEKESLKNSTITNNKKEVLSVFNYWNEMKIIVHKSSDRFNKHISAMLNNYKVSDIKEAIRLYAIVLHEEVYWWDYRWDLRAFLLRGLERFLPESRPLDTYRKKNGGNQFEQEKPKLSYME